MRTKLKLYLCVSAFFILHSAFLFAQGPAWWFARGVAATNQPVNDYAALTQGQLKWMATNAFLEMEAYFGAGSNVMALIGSFANADNYYPVNLGQLKYVAQPFYDRLYELNLTNTFPANMLGYYPWSRAPTTNDFALATIGQAKYVFSFDSAVDSDAEGLCDWREAALGTDPYHPDSDRDGLSDEDEVARGTNAKNADTDGDGFSDGWEVANGKNPLDSRDADPVLLSELRERARSRIIHYSILYFGRPPVFSNPPGSAADLNDMREALHALSGKFYKVE